MKSVHNFRVSEHLQVILAKLSKKDKNLHEQVLKKMSDVIDSSSLEHYKNLRYDMKDSKRVQIGHFVLIFQFDRNANLINFDDFDHHDNIYR